MSSICFAQSCAVFQENTEINKNTKRINVTKIYDGDTFYDKYNNSFRLIGINTPEIFQNDLNIERNIFAIKSKKFLEELIKGEEIEIKYWKKDFYKRNLLRGFYNKKDISVELIKNGLARVEYISIDPKNYYFYETNYYYKLIENQNLAKRKKIGIWKMPLLENKIFSRN